MTSEKPIEEFEKATPQPVLAPPEIGFYRDFKYKIAHVEDGHMSFVQMGETLMGANLYTSETESVKGVQMYINGFCEGRDAQNKVTKAEEARQAAEVASTEMQRFLDLREEADKEEEKIQKRIEFIMKDLDMDEESATKLELCEREAGIEKAKKVVEEKLGGSFEEPGATIQEKIALARAGLPTMDGLEEDRERLVAAMEQEKKEMAEEEKKEIREEIDSGDASRSGLIQPPQKGGLVEEKEVSFDRPVKFQDTLEKVIANGVVQEIEPC